MSMHVTGVYRADGTMLPISMRSHFSGFGFKVARERTRPTLSLLVACNPSGVQGLALVNARGKVNVALDLTVNPPVIPVDRLLQIIKQVDEDGLRDRVAEAMGETNGWCYLRPGQELPDFLAQEVDFCSARFYSTDTTDWSQGDLAAAWASAAGFSIENPGQYLVSRLSGERRTAKQTLAQFEQSYADNALVTRLLTGKIPTTESLPLFFGGKHSAPLELQPLDSRLAVPEPEIDSATIQTAFEKDVLTKAPQYPDALKEHLLGLYLACRQTDWKLSNQVVFREQKSPLEKRRRVARFQAVVPQSLSLSNETQVVLDHSIWLGNVNWIQILKELRDNPASFTFAKERGSKVVDLKKVLTLGCQIKIILSLDANTSQVRLRLQVPAQTFSAFIHTGTILREKVQDLRDWSRFFYPDPTNGDRLIPYRDLPLRIAFASLQLRRDRALTQKALTQRALTQRVPTETEKTKIRKILEAGRTRGTLHRNMGTITLDKEQQYSFSYLKDPPLFSAEVTETDLAAFSSWAEVPAR